MRLRAEAGAWRARTTDEPVTIEVESALRQAGLPTLAVVIRIEDTRGMDVLTSMSTGAASARPLDWFGRPHEPGRYRATCRLPGGLLNELTYTVTAQLMTCDPPRFEATALNVISFEITDTGALREPQVTGEWRGAVRPRLAWSVERTD